VRRRKLDLPARVNGDLPLQFDDVQLTSYAGLKLFQRYLRRMRFNAMIRTAFGGAPLAGDFGVVAMVRLLVGLLLVGGRRLDHVAYIADDLLFRRFCQLHVLPTARTVGRWLTQFTMTTVERLQGVEHGGDRARRPRTAAAHRDGGRGRRRRLDGLQVERAFRGFNPHHRKVPSYYPIMAHLAETTHVLRVKNRSGNVHDGKASLTFLRDLWTQLTTARLGSGQLRFRMDGAFFRQDVLGWLTARGVGYGIRVPFYRWLDLQQYIRAQPTWTRVAPDVSGVIVPAAATPWGAPLWVAIYRKKVAHRTATNFQLDLFDPNDCSYEYSAITSNLALTVANLWQYMAGRGSHEKTIGQLKGGLAFHTVPTMAYAANSAWQQLVVLTHNLLTNFQIETGAEQRSRTRKHTALRCCRRSRRYASRSFIAPPRSSVPVGSSRFGSPTTGRREASTRKSRMPWLVQPDFCRIRV
jgi:hypothetical protein